MGDPETERAYLQAQIRVGLRSPFEPSALPFAVVSDVNANLAALTAVLGDIDAQGIEHVLSLGDVIGYGPDPCACLDLLRERAQVALQGRHERWLLSDASATVVSQPYQAMARFTRERLQPGSERWRWLSERPVRHQEPGLLAVHRDPRGAEWSCVMLLDVAMPASPQARQDLFASFERLLLIGDNHDPWAMAEDDSAHEPRQHGSTLALPPEKVIVSVGSVGQPRDRDRRACYGVVRSETVEWRRVEYDVEETVARMQAAKLPEPMWQRLREGI